MSPLKNRPWPSAFILALLLCALGGGVAALAAPSKSEDVGRTLVVGSEENFPPFTVGQTGESASGFSVELWKAVAANSGLKYTIRVGPFYRILQEFQDGKIDVLINLAQSDERRKFADFTVSHVTLEGAIFVRAKGRAIRTEADLAGKSIIVVRGDLAQSYLEAKGWHKQLVLVESAAEAMTLLASGDDDALMLSRLVGMKTLRELQISGIQAVADPAGYSQKFSFAVGKGQSELLARINEGLALARTAGTYDALYDKWFGQYEDHPNPTRELLFYVIPIALGLLGVTGAVWFKRRRERNESEAALRKTNESLERKIEQLQRIVDGMRN